MVTPVKAASTEPRVIEMPPQKMAVVRGKGAPQAVFAELLPALYGSVYTLKFDLKKKGLATFKVSGLRARYPDALRVPMQEWTHIIGLPVPADTTVLPRKVPGVAISLETWEYGTVAEILHLGAYDKETPTIERLLRFIKDQGYVISGDHEEEYLTRPDAKAPKTIIRYPIRRDG